MSPILPISGKGRTSSGARSTRLFKSWQSFEPAPARASAVLTSLPAYIVSAKIFSETTGGADHEIHPEDSICPDYIRALDRDRFLHSAGQTVGHGSNALPQFCSLFMGVITIANGETVRGCIGLGAAFLMCPTACTAGALLLLPSSMFSILGSGTRYTDNDAERHRSITPRCRLFCCYSSNNSSLYFH